MKPPIVKPAMPAQQPQYALAQLDEYVKLHTHLIGGKPKKLNVKKEFYQFYIQSAKDLAKQFGLPAPKSKPKFGGIEITCR